MASTTTVKASSTLGNPVADAVSENNILAPLYVKNFQAALSAAGGGSAPGTISDLLSGKLPKDVQDMLTQKAAELNISQGRFGEAAGFRTMRDIGKTSLDAVQMGMGDLSKLMPNMPDLDKLVQENRTYDLEKTQMDTQQAQFQEQLAEKQKEFDETSALDKLKYQLSAKSEAAGEKQFGENLDWEKELSSWNKKYEGWVNKTNAGLSQQLISNKASNQSQANTATMSTMKTQQDSFTKYLQGIISQMSSYGQPAGGGLTTAAATPTEPGATPVDVAANNQGANWTPIEDQWKNIISIGDIPLGSE